VGQLADPVGRHPRLPFRALEGVRLDRGAVGIEAARGPLDELAIRQAGGDDLSPDGVRESDVAADVEAQPRVRPLGRARSSRIDDVEARRPFRPIDGLEDMVEEDRMRLPGVAAPEDDQIGVLDLTV
jgi:hypothetical protein